MKITFEIDSHENVDVKNMGFKVGNSIEIKLGDLELILPESIAERIYEGIEQAMWDDSEWSSTLRNRIDELESEVNNLEEQISDLESESVFNNYDY